MCRPREVDVQYRRNLAHFLDWEKREALRQQEQMMGYRYKNPRRGFRVPDWIGVLAVLALFGVAVWLFRTVVLHE